MVLLVHVLPISPPFEHHVLHERVRSLNLLCDSLRKVNRYVGINNSVVLVNHN